MFNTFNPMAILYQLPAIFLALSFHEFSHAYIADKLGDETPRNQGRLTLDPLSHIDPVGLLFFVFIGFGWAKPVQINPSRFKNPKIGDTLVSLGGPLSNLFLAFVAYGILQISAFGLGFKNAIFLEILYPIIRLNIVLAVFNLLPVPPLDGFHIVRNFISYKYNRLLWNIERYGFLILILLSFSGILSSFIYGITYAILAAMESFYSYFYPLLF